MAQTYQMHLDEDTSSTTISTKYQPRSPSIINALHHSAHNSDLFGSPSKHSWDVELQYPSGFSERFTLIRNGKISRKEQTARSLEPCQDLLRTVQLMLKYAIGPGILLTNLCLRLQSAWKHDSETLFKQTLATMQQYIMANPMPFNIATLPTDLIHHFFDQLYDRAIAPNLSSLKSGRGNSTYGELRPAFLSTIFKQAQLGDSSLYLDLGSGIGNTAFQAALETGCEAHGIERERQPHLLGAWHLQQFHARAVLWGFRHGPIHLHQGDFLHSQLAADLIKEADLIVVNNFKFEPETDAKLYERLQRSMKVGATVVSMKPLLPMGRARGNNEGFAVEKRQYAADSVSWSAKEGDYYIATKKMDMSV